jgi:acyl-CoA synthetase (AMP-forming)/AMP-acid ligase II
VDDAKKPANGRAHAQAAELAKENDRAAALFFEKQEHRRAQPKLYTHDHLLSAAEKLVELSHLTSNDCILSELPFAHTGGFIAGLLAVVATGAKMILGEPDNAAALLQTMADQQVTVYSGGAAGYQRLVEETTNGPSEVEALRLCWCDGAPLSPEMAKALQQRRFRLQPL